MDLQFTWAYINKYKPIDINQWSLFYCRDLGRDFITFRHKYILPYFTLYSALCILILKIKCIYGNARYVCVCVSYILSNQLQKPLIKWSLKKNKNRGLIIWNRWIEGAINYLLGIISTFSLCLCLPFAFSPKSQYKVR